VSNYYSIITERGLEKLAWSKANGKAVRLKTIAIGDAAGNDDALPSGNQSALIREVYRAEINRLFQHEQDTNILVAELHIPSNVGGFIIREAGIFDEDGELFAVGRYPATVKPNLSDGIAREEIVQLAIAHSNNSQIELKIDPSIVMASRQYVNNKLLDVSEPKILITVGQDADFKDLQAAWDSIKGKRLNNPLTIQIKPGTHEIATPINLSNPPIGSSIHITGDTNNPDNVVLYATYSTNHPIIYIQDVPAISFSGVTIKGNDYEKTALHLFNSKMTAANQSLKISKVRIGLYLTFNSSTIFDGMTISDCVIGVYNDFNSVVHARNLHITCNDNKESCIGISSVLGGIVYVNNSTITNAYRGINTSSQGLMYLFNMSISHCDIAVFSSVKSNIWSTQSKINHCKWAFYCSDNSYGHFSESEVDNCENGYFATLQSFIRAESTSNKITNCQTPYSPPLSTTPGNYNSQIYWS